MAVTGVSNLAELISSQSPGQGQDAPAGAQPAQVQSSNAAAPTADNFTPSTQSNSAQTTAQDAGIFQVSQFALSSATAETISAQTAAPAPAAAPPAAPLQAGGNAVAASTTNTAGEPQTMNSDLLELGLSNHDIQDIDRVASVTKNFNPIVYNDLIQQFETQAAEQKALGDGGSQPVSQPKSTAT